MSDDLVKRLREGDEFTIDPTQSKVNIGPIKDPIYIGEEKAQARIEELKTTVWLGFECHYDGCDVHRHLRKVFDCEVKAFLWIEEMEATDYEWREFKEREVE